MYIYRCKNLSENADIEREEADKVRKQVVTLLEELEESNISIDKEKKHFRETERRTLQTYQSEIKKNVIKAINEQEIIHETAVRALQHQHLRDMGNMREELSEERKKYSGKMKKEISMRVMVEGREKDLQREISELRDSNARLSADHIRVVEGNKTDQNKWAIERQSLISTCDTRIAVLKDDKELDVLRSQSEWKNKSFELTQKYEMLARNKESSFRDLLIQEVAAEKIRENAMVQKKFSRDIEILRNEERRVARKEIEDLKLYYLNKEKQTSEDLDHLEKLHDERSKRFEYQITVLRQKTVTAEDNHHVTFQELSKSVEDHKNSTVKYKCQHDDNTSRIDSLTKAIQISHTEIQVCSCVYRYMSLCM